MSQVIKLTVENLHKIIEADPTWTRKELLRNIDDADYLGETKYFMTDYPIDSGDVVPSVLIEEQYYCDKFNVTHVVTTC